MLQRFRERLREVAVRAGLAGVPEPVIMALAAALVVLSCLAAWRAIQAQAAPGSGVSLSATAATTDNSREERSTEATVVVVHVAGRVARPGVYRLRTGARGADAVAAAGGAMPDADTSAVNLAAPLKDGQQLVLPAAGAPSGPAGTQGGSAAPVTAGGGARAPGAKVDLNTADAAALDALPGVGPSTAKKIVDDREANGPFKTAEDLLRVAGIGPKKFDALKDLVTAEP